MIPLYFALKQAGIHTLLCSTMQHDEMLTEVFEVFGVRPDFDLGICGWGKIFFISRNQFCKKQKSYLLKNPSLVIVQGDTTSTMAQQCQHFI